MLFATKADRARSLERDIRFMKWSTFFLVALAVIAAAAQEWVWVIRPGVSAGLCAAFWACFKWQHTQLGDAAMERLLRQHFQQPRQ